MTGTYFDSTTPEAVIGSDWHISLRRLSCKSFSRQEILVLRFVTHTAGECIIVLAVKSRTFCGRAFAMACSHTLQTRMLELLSIGNKSKQCIWQNVVLMLRIARSWRHGRLNLTQSLRDMTPGSVGFKGTDSRE